MTPIIFSIKETRLLSSIAANSKTCPIELRTELSKRIASNRPLTLFANDKDILWLISICESAAISEHSEDKLFKLILNKISEKYGL